MIHAVFIFNTNGVSRLTKFYFPPSSLTPAQKATLPQRVFQLISPRPPTLCNFIDTPDIFGANKKTGNDYDALRLVYRCYATLYFAFIVDGLESELGILDLIQVFVESLDRAFENVCELDLVFHFDEVHHILAEVIQGGLVLETNVDEIAHAVTTAAQARKTSYAEANPLSFGTSPVAIGGGVNRSTGIQTPLGWLTGKVTGLGAR